jgi:hypothetical protein
MESCLAVTDLGLGAVFGYPKNVVRCVEHPLGFEIRYVFVDRLQFVKVDGDPVVSLQVAQPLDDLLSIERLAVLSNYF